MEAQHGILVERAYQIHSFSHLTFHELFVAKYITDNAAQGTIERLMHYIADKRWHEVFVMVASILPNASHFFELIIKVINLGTEKSSALADLRIRLKTYSKLSPVQRVVLVRKGFKIIFISRLLRYEKKIDAMMKVDITKLELSEIESYQQKLHLLVKRMSEIYDMYMRGYKTTMIYLDPLFSN